MQKTSIPFLFEAVEPEVLKAVEYAWDNNFPVLLKGETGTGKTALIRALARKHGKEFRRINLNGGTTADELVGRVGLNKTGTYWIDGILTDAMRKGHTILVDELNAARPEISFALHSLLDDDRQLLLSDNPDIPNEVVKPHPDFRFFAAINPRDYAGTNEMNKALISRFPVVVEVGYQKPEVELKIIQAHTPFADTDKINEFISFANEVRKSYSSEEINFIVSPREIISTCNLLHHGFTLKDALTAAILNKCEKEDKVALQGLMKLQFGFTDNWKQSKTLGEREREVKEAEKKWREMAKPFAEWHKSWEAFVQKASEVKKGNGKNKDQQKKEMEELHELRIALKENAEKIKDQIQAFKFASKSSKEKEETSWG